jgi:hypothetical protein
MRGFRGRGAWLGLVSGLAVTGLATVAAAQSDTERARELFAEGVQLMDSGRPAEAVERFEATLALREAPAVHFNLALAYHELGRYGRAADHFDAVVEDDEAPADMRRQSRRTLRRIRGQIGTLTVNLEGDSAGVELSIDEWSIPAERIGTPIRVAEGIHRVGAARGEQRGSREVSITAGENSTVTLRLGAPSARDAAAAGYEPDEFGDDTEEASDGGGIFGQWWFWTAVGVIVVGAIVAGILIAQPGGQDPVQGTLSPGVLEVSP